MTYAYLRQITDQNSLSQQQQYILSYSLSKGLDIEKEVLEYSSINNTIEEREKFEDFIHALAEGDSIVTASLSVLSNRIDEVIKIINCMLTHNVTLHIVDSKTLINRESKMSNVFPLLANLGSEKKGKKGNIGRPRGSKSTSKFDKYRSEIISLLTKKKSVSSIARELDVSRSSLKDYIESRELKELIEKSWVEVSQSDTDESDNPNALLICPFEKQKKEENNE